MTDEYSQKITAEDVDKRLQKRRDRRPIPYAHFVAIYPKTAFGVTLFGHLFLAFLNLILFLAGYDIFPADFQHFPLFLPNDIVARREKAWISRDTEDPAHIHRYTVDSIGPTWDRGSEVDNLILYYTVANQGNVFQKNIFNQMEQLEDSIYNLTSYQSSFCQLNAPPADPNCRCIRPTSILRYFDGTYQHLDPVFYDPNFDNISAVLLAASTNPETLEGFRYFLGKGYRISYTESFSNVTRTSIPIGYIMNASNAEVYDPFLQEEVKPLVEEFSKALDDGLKINYYSFLLFSYDVQRQAIYDMMLAIGSLLFILFFLWIQTKSLWITGWALLSVVTSFWITNLIYRIVLDYRYIGYFHVISIFIILGLAADDFFVFFHAWKDTFLAPYKTLSHRLSDSYRSAAGSMFFTSLTTLIAFMVGGFSPLLPLASFGVFFAVLVGVNYISVIIFFPTVVITYHLFFEKSCCPCCNRPSKFTLENTIKPGTTGEGTNSIAMQNGFPAKGCDNSQSGSIKSSIESIKIETTDVKKLELHMKQEARHESIGNSISDSDAKRGEVEQDEILVKANPGPILVFFRDYYFRFIAHKVVRWIIVFVFLVFVAFFTYFATRLEPSAEELKIYRKETNYGQAMSLEGTAFVPSGDQFVRIFIVWGMEPQDMSGCHKTDYNCRGRRIWNDVFDLNTPPAQLALQDFCNKLKYGLTSEELSDLMIRNDSVTGKLEVDCFMDNMETYLKKTESDINGTMNLEYPLTQMKMTSFMEHYPQVYDTDSLPIAFYRYLEIGVTFWMTNGYRMLSTPDFIIFNSLVGESQDGNNTKTIVLTLPYQPSVNATTYYGSMLRYASVAVNLSLGTKELNYIKGLPVMDSWEKFLNTELSEMPVQLRGGFQTTETTWHWLKVQQSLSYNAIMGIIIGISIACPVLIIATCNFLVGVIATVIIGLITITVVGVLPLVGWKLDVMVSLNLSILVGLAVDYVVHLAEGYSNSHRLDRRGRVQDMLGSLGPSVLWGATTTVGAAFFMIFAKLQFFMQFGACLLCTIGFSLVYSLLLFSTTMVILGPQKDVGSLSAIYNYVRVKIKGHTTPSGDDAASSTDGQDILLDDRRRSENGLVKISKTSGDLRPLEDLEVDTIKL